MQIDRVKVLTAPVNLLGLLLAKQGKLSLAARIGTVSQSCAASQLAKFQQNAACKRERFESAVNNAWQQH